MVASDSAADSTEGRGMSDEIVLRGHPGIGPKVEGEALVSRQGFSARYDLNRRTGVFSRETHDLFGQSIVGKVLNMSPPVTTRL